MARRQALYLEMLAFEVLLSCRDAPTGNFVPPRPAPVLEPENDVLSAWYRHSPV
jgi:hypothetical protein